MANTVFKLRRSSVAGKQPNTSTLAIGELALNLTDRKLYSSDGTNVWETGANLSTLSVSTNTNVNNVIFSGLIYANGSPGTTGQVLTSNSTGIYWSSASGGGGALPLYKQFTGDGSTTIFTVVGGYTPNYISVYLNGVLLRNGTEVDVSSGSNVVISPAPPNSSLIDVVGVSALYSTGVNMMVSQQFTANGSANTFAITNGYVANQVQVYLNGVKQVPGTDVILTSGANVDFISTPANGYIVDVYGVQSAVALGSSVLTVGSNVNISTSSISIGNSSVNTQIVAGNVFLNGSTLVVGNTATNVTVSSSSLSLGTSWTTNTTGLYHTGTINAASHTVGTSTISNSTGVYTGIVNGSSITVGSSFIANSTGTYHTGIVNAATVQIGTSIVANSSKLVLGTAVGLQANGSIGSNGQVLTSNATTVYWANATAGATGGGSDKAFWENDITITTDYTITTNKNAMTAGPITINSGVTITVPSGSTWTVV